MILEIFEYILLVCYLISQKDLRMDIRNALEQIHAGNNSNEVRMELVRNKNVMEINEGFTLIATLCLMEDCFGVTRARREDLITIFVTGLEDKIITIEALLSDTVESARQKIQSKTSIHMTDVMLNYGAKILKDACLLIDYNMRNDATLICTERLRGGTKGDSKTPEKQSGTKIAVKSTKTSASKGLGTSENKFQIYTSFKENELIYEQAKDKIICTASYDVYTDGATRGNPGEMGVGYIIFDHLGYEVYHNAIYVGPGTNNKAEHLGIIYGLRSALNLEIRIVRVFSDSELAVNQIRGTYKVNDDGLRSLTEETVQLREKFFDFKIEWISRNQNEAANKLAQGCLVRNDDKMNLDYKVIGQSDC